MSDSRPSQHVLVDGEWLEARLDDPTVKIIEIQYEPDIDEYTEGHIPGAQHWFWKTMLWHPQRREFPDPELMAERLGSHGICPEDTLVFYSGRNQYAMYAYWVTKVMNGHPDVRVLDGAQTRWDMDGRPVSTETPGPAPVKYHPQRSVREDSSRVDQRYVLESLSTETTTVIDARYPAEYEGKRVKPGEGFDYGAERHGRIPGARHLMFRRLFNDDNTLKTAPELEAELRSVGAGPDQAESVIAYCRLGHRASSIWFTSTQILGWDHVKVYDGSWTEWGSSVGVPVEC